jgi:deoxyribodipyrimidine photolyase
MRAASRAAATAPPLPPPLPPPAPNRVFVVLYSPFDLRVTDHPALAGAAAAAAKAIRARDGAAQVKVAVVPLFLWSDPEHEAAGIGFPRQRARVSEVWVREALADVDASLRARGSRLLLPG